MKLQLLTFNFRRLNEDAAVDTMREYITALRPSLDIFALQEHKARAPLLDRLGTRLWKHASTFAPEATVGHGHAAQDPGVGYDGVFTFIHPKWVRQIGASGSL